MTLPGEWMNRFNNLSGPSRYRCGWCDTEVASRDGYRMSVPIAILAVCPNCNRPSYLEGPIQVPGALPGRPVAELPSDVDSLYAEARSAIASRAHTAAVLAFRKLLMHLAVAEGAAEGLSFIQYVEYLDGKGFVPPKGKGWVDHIRTKGNEANHEIVLMTKDDAERLCTFTEMLLRFMYEFPNLVPPAQP
jgi:uncharacterized protein DUF4145